MEKKIRSHVALPLNLIKEFENDKNTVCVFDLLQKKSYFANGTKVGVEKGYYSQQCELFLSSEIEGPFHDLITKLKEMNHYYEKTNFLNNNRDVLERFFKYQFLRSKKVLENTNKYSLAAIALGSLSHESLIAIMSKNDSNILSLIEGKLFARMLVVKSTNKSLIDNSLGFYTVVESKKIKSFVVPISPKEAIYISSYNEKDLASHYFATDNEINILNKLCLITEKQIGNGFLIGKKFDNFADIH